jgi:hypothetical protein
MGAFKKWTGLSASPEGVNRTHMRKLFIAMIAGGFLLLSGVAASAKPDSGNGQQSQNGQQQTQAQNDQKTTPPATKPVTPAAKPATPAPKPAATTPECGETGDNTGDHQHEDAATCNDQNEQAGVNESKTNANDTAGGNNED